MILPTPSHRLQIKSFPLANNTSSLMLSTQEVSVHLPQPFPLSSSPLPSSHSPSLPHPPINHSHSIPSISSTPRHDLRPIFEPTKLMLPPLINRLRLPLALLLRLHALTAVMLHQLIEIGLRAGGDVEGGACGKDPRCKCGLVGAFWGVLLRVKMA